MRTAAVVLMGRPTSRLIAEGRKPVIGLRFQTKISTREFLTSIEVHADVPRAGLDGWSRKRAFCCPVLWAPEDGDFASGRKDREPATAVREPFAVIVSPVAANVSRGTAPVAEIVSPKGPPFASLSIDDCEPLHVAVAPALALTDADGHARAVDVADLEPDHLGDAQARGVDRGQER